MNKKLLKAAFLIVTVVILTTCSLEGDIYAVIARSELGFTIPGKNLKEKWDWFFDNAVPNGKYIIEVTTDESVGASQSRRSFNKNRNITLIL